MEARIVLDMQGPKTGIGWIEIGARSEVLYLTHERERGGFWIYIDDPAEDAPQGIGSKVEIAAKRFGRAFGADRVRLELTREYRGEFDPKIINL